MLANQMFPAALGIFIVLIQDLKFPAWMYAILFSPKEMLFGFNYGVHNR
jgi:hypothetical protein